MRPKAKPLPAVPIDAEANYIAQGGRMITLDKPTLASSITCRRCGGSGFAPYLDPSVDKTRVWFCANLECCALDPVGEHPLKPKQASREIQGPTSFQRFMSRYDIGDIYASCSLVEVRQSPATLATLKAFAVEPSGGLILGGPKGTGKTFAALSLCHQALIAGKECGFYTSTDLASLWANRSTDDHRGAELTQRLRGVDILVIDDVGQAATRESFLELLYDVINYRSARRSLGTVLTTNLEPAKLVDLLGEGIADRLCGKFIRTSGDSRRGWQ